MRERVSKTLLVSDLGKHSLVGAIAEARDKLRDPGLGDVDITLEGNLDNLNICQIETVAENLQDLANWLNVKSTERMCMVNIWFATD